ncbi:MAG: LytTR family transcriptional regulator DNA-binding domain-containing protein [Mediterraneibacter gnavus]
MEKKLDKDGFVRCNSGYLVNLRYVEEVNENIVTVAGEKLQISRPRKRYLWKH